MKKLAIVVGHNHEAQGAIKKWPEPETEWKYNGRLAQLIADSPLARSLGVDVKVFHRTPGGGEIRRVYDLVNTWGAHASIELHFNSFGHQRARGCEVLSSGTQPSMALAAALQKEILTAIYGKDHEERLDRGVKIPTGRGRASVESGRAPAALIEPFFGSSKLDCDLADAVGQKAIADAILTGAAAALNVMPRVNLQAESRTLKESGKGQKAAIAGGVVMTVAQVGSAVFGENASAVEAVSTIKILTTYMPFAGAVAAALTGLYVWHRFQKVKAARAEDHERATK